MNQGEEKLKRSQRRQQRRNPVLEFSRRHEERGEWADAGSDNQPYPFVSFVTFCSKTQAERRRRLTPSMARFGFLWLGSSPNKTPALPQRDGCCEKTGRVYFRRRNTCAPNPAAARASSA